MSALASPSGSNVGTGANAAPLHGRTFRHLLDEARSQGRRVPLEDAVAWFVPLCIDLKERHARGERSFVHPSALAIGPDGSLQLASTPIVPSLPADRAAMAPEIIATGQPGDANASVFAIGAMFYEAIVGAPIGPGNRRPRDVDPTLPESLEVLLGKALVTDPAHRPGDLGALASAMHHIAPMKSIPPPDVDVTGLDMANGEPVDIRMSLLPPIEIQFSVPPAAPSVPGGGLAGPGSSPGAGPARRDPNRQLADLKARLEADTRPRYVVNKDRMDHGPFSAVEVLQQIASHAFQGTDTLRDELTGVSQTIDEWQEFAPFAEHARMHRQIAQEKKEVAKVESAEKKAGVAKFVVGGLLALAIVAGGATWVVKKVGERKDGSDFADDPSAIDLSGGGSLKGAKKAATGGKAGGGGGGFVGGKSYEAALASNNQQITMGQNTGPDLTDAQLSRPLQNAAFISGCGAPNSMKVTVKVAVQNGRAVGVSVYTTPSDSGVSACIDRAVRGLGWPSNPKMDFTTTTY